MSRTGKYLSLLLIAILATSIAVSFLLTIESAEAQVGVAQRDKFSFSIRNNFSNHGLEIGSIFYRHSPSENNNTDVQYEIGSVNQATHSFNMTDQNGQTYSVNTLTYGNVVFYESNLNKNDKLYPITLDSSPSGTAVGLNYTAFVVNDSKTVSYPSGQRTINHANYTLETDDFNAHVNVTTYEDIYFDKSTGVATHFEQTQVFTDEKNSTQYSILNSTWDLTQSSVWNVGTSTPTSSSTVFEFLSFMILPSVVTATSVTALGIRRKKAQISLSHIPIIFNFSVFKRPF